MRPRSWLLWLLASLALPASGAQASGFDAFLAAYRAAAPEVRETLTRELIERQTAAGGFPIASEDGEVVILYQAPGDEEDVRLVGDFLTRSFYNVYWQGLGTPMTRAAPGSRVFFARLAVEPDARLDYAFLVEGERLPDPLNPRRIFSGTGGGEVSELLMPGYRVDPALLAQEAPRGTLHVVEEPWATPRVTIYLPPGYDPAARYPTLYTTDGSAWLELLGLPSTIDHLIAQRRIEPLIAVLVDVPEDRTLWHYYNPDFLDYFERVVGYVDQQFATRARADQRLHAGTSSGGRASLFLALERPDLFARAGALSPTLDGPISYWQPYLTGGRRPDPGLELWMSAGTYEGVVAQGVETMAEHFRGWELPVATHITHEGHSFGAWRNAAPRLLEHFFGARGAALDPDTAHE